VKVALSDLFSKTLACAAGFPSGSIILPFISHPLSWENAKAGNDMNRATKSTNSRPGTPSRIVDNWVTKIGISPEVGKSESRWLSGPEDRKFRRS